MDKNNRNKEKQNKVLPGIEPCSSESESEVITITLQNHVMLSRGCRENDCSRTAPSSPILDTDHVSHVRHNPPRPLHHHPTGHQPRFAIPKGVHANPEIPRAWHKPYYPIPATRTPMCVLATRRIQCTSDSAPRHARETSAGVIPCDRCCLGYSSSELGRLSGIRTEIKARPGQDRREWSCPKPPVPRHFVVTRISLRSGWRGSISCTLDIC